MTEEESRLVATHVAVTFGIAVDDIFAAHLLTRIASLVLVDPVRVGPVVLRNAAIKGVTGHERSGEFLKVIVEVFIVQEDPIVVVIAIEAVLDRANGLGNFPEVRVAS